ncbi:Arm DNA-binding domain-containing protein [Thermaurantiacus tibetensis]|uniref:Arm DNA-binding domain-containing protein n=1 Tax=Thermaurantiacus tibetensis TaxID=2759035 RepID=UPI00188FA755|nr:Arm DNA-binding domain-containing protein [Thermaurantiacus tibetensis]
MGRRLSARRVETAAEGWHFEGAGSGLALRVRGNGRPWVLRVRMDGRQRDIGLGRWPDVSLAMAPRRRHRLFRKVRSRACLQGRTPQQPPRIAKPSALVLAYERGGRRAP